MKKLILAITASLCIATLISSCNNLGINAPKMDSDEATQLIVETLEKNINFDEWKYMKSAGWRRTSWRIT